MSGANLGLTEPLETTCKTWYVHTCLFLREKLLVFIKLSSPLREVRDRVSGVGTSKSTIEYHSYLSLEIVGGLFFNSLNKALPFSCSLQNPFCFIFLF